MQGYKYINEWIREIVNKFATWFTEKKYTYEKGSYFAMSFVLLGNIYFSGLTMYDFSSVSSDMLCLMCMPEEIHSKGARFGSEGIHT